MRRIQIQCNLPWTSSVRFQPNAKRNRKAHLQKSNQRLDKKPILLFGEACSKRFQLYPFLTLSVEFQDWGRSEKAKKFGFGHSFLGFCWPRSLSLKQQIQFCMMCALCLVFVFVMNTESFTKGRKVVQGGEVTVVYWFHTVLVQPSCSLAVLCAVFFVVFFSFQNMICCPLHTCHSAFPNCSFCMVLKLLLVFASCIYSFLWFGVFLTITVHVFFLRLFSRSSLCSECELLCPQITHWLSECLPWFTQERKDHFKVKHDCPWE